MTNTTNRSTSGINWTAINSNDEEGHHGDHENWGKDKDDEHERRWDRDSEPRAERHSNCKCSSVAGHWEHFGKGRKQLDKNGHAENSGHVEDYEHDQHKDHGH